MTFIASLLKYEPTTMDFREANNNQQQIPEKIDIAQKGKGNFKNYKILNPSILREIQKRLHPLNKSKNL